MFFRNSLEDQAYEIIKEMIATGRLSSGRLHTVGEIADVFEVSKTPIRIALQQLQNEGLIRVHANRGFSIRKFTEKDIRYLFEMRKAMEGFALERFIVERKEVKELRLCVERQEKYAIMNDMESFLTEDVEFHNIPIRETGNEFIETAFNNLTILRQVIGMQVLISTGIIYETFQQHLEIFKAIDRYDYDMAKTVLYKHFDRATKVLCSNLSCSDILNTNKDLRTNV